MKDKYIDRIRGWQSRFCGFSLAEVIIAVAVLALLAAAVLPGVLGSDGSRLRKATDLFVSDLQYAQIGSQLGGSDPCVVVLREDGGGYHIARAGQPEAPVVWAATQETAQTVFGEGRAAGLDGVRIEGSLGAIAYTRFGSLADESDVQATLRSGDASVVIEIDGFTGHARVGAIQ